MRAVVVYESMYGNTRLVAEAIGEGLRPEHDVVVVPAGQADPAVLDGVQVLVVGGPTHVHGMTRRRSREAAVEAAREPGSGLVLEDSATGPGVREWLSSVGHLNVLAAAFDTRMHGPAALTGRASKAIGRELSRHGVHPVGDPESFLVTKDNRLERGEADRARRWGEYLAVEVSELSRRRDREVTGPSDPLTV
jgi:hypothetical protein